MTFKDRHLVGGAAAACAVCCAAPVVGLLGVAGFAATAATLAFAGVVFAVVVGAASIAAVVARRSRYRSDTCAVPARGVVDVDLGPTRTSGPGRPTD
jgi:hypothetical protein